MRPGVNVISQESSPPRTPPSDTDRTFAAGYTERGATGTALVFTSFEDAKRQIGARNNNTARAWDAIQSFFRRGGRRLLWSRVVGDAAVKATANLDDGTVGAPFSLVATAVGEGAWYNGLNLTVTDDAGDREIVITHDSDSTVNERSGFKATQDELVAWSQNSKYIRLALGASALLPAVAANVPLAGGDDDTAGIDDAARVASLEAFIEDLGPGQISIPGATTAAAWDGILAAAEARNRTAILAYPDTSDEATLLTLAETARARGRFGGAFAGWLVVPGEGAGVTKTVSPELAICAKIAVHDGVTRGLGQNKPVAGSRRGQIEGVLSVTQGDSATWKDPDARERLNEAGVNLIRERFGGVVIYGWHSLVDPETDPGWTNLGHRRLQTAIYAKALAAMEEYMFEEIAGDGVLIGNVNGSLTAFLQDYYVEGSLYGATAQEAYRVDTDSVNDDETAALKQVNASITVVESEFAEEINVYVTKNLITEGVGA